MARLPRLTSGSAWDKMPIEKCANRPRSLPEPIDFLIHPQRPFDTDPSTFCDRNIILYRQSQRAHLLTTTGGRSANGGRSGRQQAGAAGGRGKGISKSLQKTSWTAGREPRADFRKFKRAIGPHGEGWKKGRIAANQSRPQRTAAPCRSLPQLPEISSTNRRRQTGEEADQQAQLHRFSDNFTLSGGRQQPGSPAAQNKGAGNPTGKRITRAAEKHRGAALSALAL